MNIIIAKEILSITEYVLLLYIFYKDGISFTKKSSLILSAVTVFILWSAYTLNVGNNIIISSTALSIYYAFMLISNAKIFDRLIAFLLVYSIQSFFDCILLFLINVTVNRSILACSLRTSIVATITVIIILFIIVPIRAYDSRVLLIGRLPALFITSASIFSTYVITLIEEDINTSKSHLIALLILGFVVVTILSLILILVDSSRRMIRHEQKSLKQYIESNKLYLNALESKDDEYRHDMSHHFEVISGLTANEETKTLADYLAQCQVHVQPQTPMIFHSSNKVADAIILEKSLSATECNVKLECRGSLCDFYFISDYDLCTILANLLSNSIEYAGKHGEGTVTITFVTKSTDSVIKVKNSIPNDLDIAASIKTTSKGDSYTHGHGITIVKNTVQKNGSDITFGRENNFFTARVLLKWIRHLRTIFYQFV